MSVRTIIRLAISGAVFLLFLLQPIGYLILGYGSSQYQPAR